MPKLPVLSGKELVKFLESQGFEPLRQKGSHLRLRAPDGRVTTVPIHSNQDLAKGLLHKIIREDLEMSIEDFLSLYSSQ